MRNPSSEQGLVRPGLLLAYRHSLAAFVLCLAAGAASLGTPAPASAEACPNAVFRVGPSAHLPDCRAYEMVTPLFKGGGRVFPENGVKAIGPDGSTLLLDMTEALAETEGFPNLTPGGPIVTYSMRRTASGWTYAPEDPPTSEYLPFFVSGFSNEIQGGIDARTTLWFERGAGRPTNSIEIYKREAGGAIVDVGPTLPPTAPFGELILQLGAQASLYPVGVSADTSHVLFNLSKEHWPFDHSQEGFSSQGVASLYEYAGTGNTTPMLVGVDNAGNQISGCGTVLGGGEPPSETNGSQIYGHVRGGHNAVSSDGETVFFTAYPPSPKCSASALPVTELFARIDNGQPGAHTVAISEPSVEDCSACDTQTSLARPVYLGASADGSKVFFQSTQPLLGGDGSENVYEYDFGAPAGQRVVRVSGGDATVSGSTAGVEGPVEVSEDGSHVYFIARGVLSTNPNGFGQSAQPGASNLYVFERDARYPGGRTAFVAALSGDQLENLWTGNNPVSGGQSRADLTPDGRFLLFTSNTDLTPDDTSTAQQVFEYDSVTATLVRVSVGRDGFNGNGNAISGNAEIVGPGQFFEGGSYPGVYTAKRSLSADGAYVFFQSPVGLTPEAFNDKIIKSEEGRTPYAENVYEYHAGVVSLISDGQDITNLGTNGSNVQLIGTNESGADVFFETADRLVGQDTDSNVDLYDARVGGGFPAPPPAASCSGEACQGQLSGAPTLLSPGSEFQAGANPPLAGGRVSNPAISKPKAKGCRRGFVKKRGRCVRQRAKARKASRDRRTKS